MKRIFIFLSLLCLACAARGQSSGFHSVEIQTDRVYDGSVVIGESSGDMIFTDDSNAAVTLSSLLSSGAWSTEAGENSETDTYYTDGRVGIGVNPDSSDGVATLVGNILFEDLAVPIGPTAAEAGAGSVDVGSHSWKVTFVRSISGFTGSYETSEGAASNVVTISSSAKDVNLTNIPLGPAGVTTARKIYRTVAGDTGSYLLVGTIADNSTTTFTDNVADGSLGAAAPATNTTGIIEFYNTGGLFRLSDQGEAILENIVTDTLNLQLLRTDGDDDDPLLKLETVTTGTPIIDFKQTGETNWLIGPDDDDNVFTFGLHATDLDSNALLLIQEDGDLIATGDLITVGENVGTDTDPDIIQFPFDDDVRINGELGIGATPGYPLHVIGQVYGTAEVGFGVAPSINNGARFVKATTDPTAATNGLRNQLVISLSSGENTEDLYGVYGEASINNSDQNYTNVNGLAGIFGYAATSGSSTGESDYISGVLAQAANTGTGTGKTLSGLRILSGTNASGTVDELNGILIEQQSAGTVNYAIKSLATADSYLLGPLGLGGITDPADPLEVRGNVTLGDGTTEALLTVDGYVAITRDTPNVELTLEGTSYTTPDPQKWGFNVDANGFFNIRDYTDGVDRVEITKEYLKIDFDSTDPLSFLYSLWISSDINLTANNSNEFVGARVSPDLDTGVFSHTGNYRGLLSIPVLTIGAGGTANNLFSVQSAPSLNVNATGTLTNLYGFYYFDPVTVSGTLTNHYGLYIESLANGVNKWPIYSAGDQRSYFSGALEINAGGTDLDTYIEGDNDSSLFYVDAGNDRIGISTNIPSQDFSVDGFAVITNGAAPVWDYVDGAGDLGIEDELEVDGDTVLDGNLLLGGEFSGGYIVSFGLARNSNFSTDNYLFSPNNLSSGEGYTMPGAGSIKAISYGFNTNNETQAGDLDINVTKNGVALASNAVAVSGNAQYDGSFSYARDTYTFLANDRINIYIDFDAAEFQGNAAWFRVMVYYYLD